MLLSGKAEKSFRKRQPDRPPDRIARGRRQPHAPESRIRALDNGGRRVGEGVVEIENDGLKLFHSSAWLQEFALFTESLKS